MYIQQSATPNAIAIRILNCFDWEVICRLDHDQGRK